VNKTNEEVVLDELDEPSAKMFAVKMGLLDRLMMGVAALVVGGMAYWHAAGQGTAAQCGLAVLAAAAAQSMFVLLRALVPFVLRLSYVDMLHLRTPFYLTCAVLVYSVVLAPATARLFSTFGKGPVLLTLVLLTGAMVVRFFQEGGLLRLATAFFLVGMSIGISAYGLLGLVFVIVFMYFLSRGLFLRNDNDWNDQPNAVVVDYFTNPLVRSRMKWVLLFCFSAGLGLAVYLTFSLRGTRFEFGTFRQLWLSGITPDSLIFFVATAVLPIFIVLHRVSLASDAVEHPSVGVLIPYAIVGLLSLGLLVKSDSLITSTGLSFRIDDRFQVLALVSYAYSILLSMLVLLVDIRCRDFSDIAEIGEIGANKDKLSLQMRFLFIASCVAPFFFAAAVTLFAVRRQASHVIYKAPETESVEMELSPKEALKIAIARKSYGLVEHYARKILKENPCDVEANMLLGQRCVDTGHIRDAEPYADCVATNVVDDVQALTFALGVYELCGNKEKTDAVSGRLAAIKAKETSAGDSGRKRP